MKNITVVGGGTTGHLATLFLCKKYPDYKIKWIYPEVNNPVGVGEATIPQVFMFLEKLGITKEIILTELKGSLKLGIKFTDFYEKGSSYNHTFGYAPWDAYNFDWMMNTSVVNTEQVFNKWVAGHFNVFQLMDYLVDVFAKFPNLTIENKTISSFDELEDDFIVDCTGFHTDTENFKRISDKIPNNKALVYRTPYKSLDQRVPYTEAVAMDYGWIWNIPLRDEMSLGYVHDDKYDVKEEFKNYINERYGNYDESNLREIPMITGRRDDHFMKIGNKTIISLGLSSAFIEPIESTGLYFVIYGIQLMGNYLNGEISQENFNKTFNDEFDTTLDFIVAHYKFSKRDNEYWNFYKNVDIELYKPNNIFLCQGWKQVLEGYNMDNYEKNIETSFDYLQNSGIKFTEWLDKYK